MYLEIVNKWAFRYIKNTLLKQIETVDGDGDQYVTIDEINDYFGSEQNLFDIPADNFILTYIIQNIYKDHSNKIPTDEFSRRLKKITMTRFVSEPIKHRMFC